MKNVFKIKYKTWGFRIESPNQKHHRLVIISMHLMSLRSLNLKGFLLSVFLGYSVVVVRRVIPCECALGN